MWILIPNVPWGPRFCVSKGLLGVPRLLIWGPPFEEHSCQEPQTLESRRSLRTKEGWCRNLVSKARGLFLFLPHVIQVLSTGPGNTWLWGHKFTQAPAVPDEAPH